MLHWEFALGHTAPEHLSSPHLVSASIVDTEQEVSDSNKKSSTERESLVSR